MKVAAAKGLIAGHITLEMKNATEPVNVVLSAMVSFLPGDRVNHSRIFLFLMSMILNGLQLMPDISSLSRRRWFPVSADTGYLSNFICLEIPFH
jgi:hypothetical protein